MTRLRKRLRSLSSGVRRLLGLGATERERIRSERREALEHLFGAASADVTHSVVPVELEGRADVLRFEQHIVGGTLYVTADLTGPNGAQAPNGRWNQYELAICQRGNHPWAADVISQIASFTVHEPLRPGETMEIAWRVPQPSTICAFLFVDYGSFRLYHRHCGVLLCVGITAEELAECLESGSTVVLEQLRGAGIFPFTDLDRESFHGGAA